MPPLWRGETYRHDKIRLGYLSGTFRAHPTTALMGGLFARHDKVKFETIALSFGPDDGGPARRALQAAFDQFLDVAALSDQQIAERIRALEIDILIDLDGYIEHARTGILAHKPAPVQVNYLGYPGTMGASYMDYILADPVVIPAADEAWYTEKVARLPDSYQPNSNRPEAAATPSGGLLRHGADRDPEDRQGCHPVEQLRQPPERRKAPEGRRDVRRLEPAEAGALRHSPQLLHSEHRRRRQLRVQRRDPG